MTKYVWNITQPASRRRNMQRSSHRLPCAASSKGMLAAATLLHQAWTSTQKPSPTLPVAVTEIDKTQEPL